MTKSISFITTKLIQEQKENKKARKKHMHRDLDLALMIKR
jgi:hypothetical protein